MIWISLFCTLILAISSYCFALRTLSLESELNKLQTEIEYLRFKEKKRNVIEIEKIKELQKFNEGRMD